MVNRPHPVCTLKIDTVTNKHNALKDKHGPNYDHYEMTSKDTS